MEAGVEIGVMAGVVGLEETGGTNVACGGTSTKAAPGLATATEWAARGFARGRAMGARGNGAVVAGCATGVLVGRGTGNAIAGGALEGAADLVVIGAGAVPLSSAGPAARGAAFVGTGKRKVDGFSLCSATCAHAPSADVNAIAISTPPAAALRIIPNPTLFTMCCSLKSCRSGALSIPAGWPWPNPPRFARGFVRGADAAPILRAIAKSEAPCAE